MVDIIKAIADEFPYIDIIHLNHAGVGRWPMRTVRAIHDFAEENARYGATRSCRLVQTRHHPAHYACKFDQCEKQR